MYYPKQIPYLAGISKNMIRNKYRNTELNFSISDYEENLVDTCNIEKIAGENEPVKELTNNTYPESYGGRYVDNNGNNIVWICEDSTTNRKEIN